MTLFCPIIAVIRRLLLKWSHEARNRRESPMIPHANVSYSQGENFGVFLEAPECFPSKDFVKSNKG